MITVTGVVLTALAVGYVGIILDGSLRVDRGFRNEFVFGPLSDETRSDLAGPLVLLGGHRRQPFRRTEGTSEGALGERRYKEGIELELPPSEIGLEGPLKGKTSKTGVARSCSAPTSDMGSKGL